MEIKKYALTVVAALGCAAFGAYLYSRYDIATSQNTTTTVDSLPFQSNIGHFTTQNYAPTDFTQAAEASVNAVVHVRIMKNMQQYGYGNDGMDPLLQFFFGPRQHTPQQQMQRPQEAGSGSGVIISNDGYIVTNNHVIDDADQIEVTLNDRRTFKATLVGTDPTTDIALLKIDGENLHYINFGNSDAMRVGEWVLAIGNPFNLTSTVTAGIISAKSRSIGIIGGQSRMSIESFIQTDAAVNPGNSGGALVNTRGELIGINTAIASTTGSYSGYSFAVPATIVQKVTQDLKMYGEVQRALLGIQITNVSSELQKEHNLASTDGVFVAGLTDGGAAKDAGILSGDVIISIDEEKTNGVAELQEKIGRKRPGENVKIELIRDGETKHYIVTLRNIKGTTDVVKPNNGDKLLGATFEKVSDEQLKRLQIRNGIKITNLAEGKLKQYGVKEGYIITKANRQPITSVNDFEQIVAQTRDGLFLSGIYPNGKVTYYAINLEE
jgi:Do/DeqQ family serine protease